MASTTTSNPSHEASSSINIPTPPGSSHSNNASHLSHLSPRYARRQGSTDSYNSDHSATYSYTSRNGQFHIPASPGASLTIRTSHSPRIPRHLAANNDVDHLDIDSSSPISRRGPPSRKNSRDYDGNNDGHHEPSTIQVHLMPKNMILPLPDRTGEMKSMMDFNKSLMDLIRHALGEEVFAECTELWCNTRRSEVSDHEFLRRSKYYICEKCGDNMRLWSEWCMMVGYDHSLDLTKDENGVERKVSEYIDTVRHMKGIGEEEEEE